MSVEKGDQVILGVGFQATRDTPVDPQVWVPGRTPSGVKLELEKKLIQETKATKVESYGSEIVQKKVVGDHEFNLRCQSLGYFLKSLLGSCSSVAKSAPNDAVYDHTITIDTDPQNPALSLGLQSTIQAYRCALAIVSKLEINIPPDDIVYATASFLAKSEAEHASFSPSFSSDDKYFRHQDATIKIATNLAGLDAAEALSLKEFKLAIDNKGRVDPVIGSLDASDVLGMEMAIEGNLSLNYGAKTYHDIFADGDYKAMRITLERDDVTIGSDQHPKLNIDLARISFEGYSPDRPLDDIVKEGIDFKAHYSETDSKMFEMILTNLITAYTSA